MQNLNNFILDYIGLCFVLTFILICAVVFIVFLRHKNNDNDIKNLFLKTQGELAGRLASLSESNLQEQNRLFSALNDQKLAVLKIMDDKLLAVGE